MRAKKKNWYISRLQEFCWLVKKKSKKTVNIEEIIFYLKSMYSTRNKEPRTFIYDIPTKEPSFEAITEYLITFPKSDRKMKIWA